MVGPVLFILGLLGPYSLAELPEPVNCTLKENLPCLRYKFEGDCAPDDLQNRFSDIYVNTDENPGIPYKFEAEQFYDQHSNGNTYPGVNLTFTPPGDVSIKYVRGFEIMQYRADKSTSPTCYIYDMSAANWSTAYDKDVMFLLRIFPLKPATLYTYDLYTLPKPKAEYDQSRTLGVLGQNKVNDGDPGQWVASIKFRVIREHREIWMDFVEPPDSYGFTRFYVSLRDAEKGTWPVSNEEIHSVHYIFTNVTPSVYQIWLQPIDPYSYEYPACKCKEKSGSGGCDSCMTTRTANFTMGDFTMTTTTTETTETTSSAPTVGPPSDDPHKSPKDDSSISMVKVLSAVFGTILGIVLIGLVLVVVYRYRCRPFSYDLKGKDMNHNINGGFDHSVVAITEKENEIDGPQKHNNIPGNERRRKKIFLLYEEDHVHHRNVVNKFATYLSHHCQFDVELAELQQDAPWVHQDLAQADYVVIVNSEAAYKAYMSSNSPQSSPNINSSSSINSIRNKFTKDERYDHIIMVYFSYTDEKYILPDICTGYKYKLMKHFTDFLLHAHHINRTDNLSNYNLPFDGSHHLRPLGQHLLDAIEQATKYEAENPKWYILSHGMFRCISNTSDRSHYPSGDSGCIDDFSPRPSPEIDSRYPWSNSICPENVSQRHDGVTVTESDQKINGFHPAIIPKSVPKQRPPLVLSPVSFVHQHGYVEPELFTPPTDSPSECEFQFCPPDLSSNYDAFSQTQSKQLEIICNQYTEDMKKQEGMNESNSSKEKDQGHSEGQGRYDKKGDLDILDACSREVMFNPAMEFETVSIESMGGISI